MKQVTIILIGQNISTIISSVKHTVYNACIRDKKQRLLNNDIVWHVVKRIITLESSKIKLNDLKAAEN